jgi:fatty-acid desaturase
MQRLTRYAFQPHMTPDVREILMTILSRSTFGGLGAFVSWATFIFSAYLSVAWSCVYISEIGGGCGTGRMEAQAMLMMCVPVALIISGSGWTLSHFMHHFQKSARLGFISTAIVTISCFVFISFLLRDLMRFFG